MKVLMKTTRLRIFVPAFTATLVTLSATSFAQAKGPEVQCLTNASFLQQTDTSNISFLESTIQMKVSNDGDLKGVTTVDLGNQVSVRIEAIVDPKGSIRNKGVDWLVLRTRMTRKEVSGQVTVLNAMTTDSDKNSSGTTMIAANAHLENPEIETAQLNNSNAKIDDLVKLGLLPPATVWYSMVNCVYFKN